MRALVEAFGADWVQWKALMRAALKIDFRTASIGRSGSGGRSGGRMLLFQLAFYLILGAFMAMVVAWVSDLFLAALLVISYVLFMVGTAMLLDHNSALTSPSDYGVLGFQPITSRTYFAARLANVLAYTLAITAAVGLPPVVMFFVEYGVEVGLAAAAAICACSLTVTFAIVVGYASLARLVGPKRLRNVMSWVQLALSFVFYGGYFLVAESASESFLSSLTLPRTPWLMAYPGSWFASWIALAAGETGAGMLIPAAAGIVLPVALLRGLRGRLSLEYAQQLGDLVSASDGAVAQPPARGRMLRWFRGGEARAVALLVRSQFRHDMRFRMGVLAIVPLTLLYLIMGLRDGDPDAAGGLRNGGNLGLVTLAVVLFPALLRMNLTRSDAYRAAWVFFATPADRVRLIIASKNVLVAWFLLPYLAFVGAVLVFFTESPAFLAIYLLFAGLVGHLVLLIATLTSPELPFSLPMDRTRSTGMVFFFVIVMGAGGMLIPLATGVLVGNPAGAAAVLGGLVLVSVVVSVLMRRRIAMRTARLEFQG